MFCFGNSWFYGQQETKIILTAIYELQNKTLITLQMRFSTFEQDSVKKVKYPSTPGRTIKKGELALSLVVMIHRV
jgi:hypothetical protein